MTEAAINPFEQRQKERVWNCKKCGLMRSNLVQHLHGVALPEK